MSVPRIGRLNLHSHVCDTARLSVTQAVSDWSRVPVIHHGVWEMSHVWAGGCEVGASSIA